MASLFLLENNNNNNLVLMKLKINSVTLKDDHPFFEGNCCSLYLKNNNVTKART